MSGRSRNVAKLLARLNPKGMPLQFSSSRGSAAPELTSIDVAGALGAASSGDARVRLAIDVLCLRWWPARVEGPMRPVGYREVVHEDPPLRRGGETRRRVERIPVEAPSETAAFIAIAQLIERRLSLHQVPARANSDEFRERWARAIIAEYRKPNHCPTCSPGPQPGELAVPQYKGNVLSSIEWVVCPDCDGSAVASWGKHRRARAVKIRESTFRDSSMNGIHEGALALLRELEHRGARRLVRSLGR